MKYGHIKNKPDGISGFHPNPLWNWAILLHLLRQLHFNSERFVGRLQ